MKRIHRADRRVADRRIVSGLILIAAVAGPAAERVIAQEQATGSITVTGRKPDADDKIVCRVVHVTRSRLTAGKTCRTVAEWRIELEREQDYARDVAEDQQRRDRRPR